MAAIFECSRDLSCAESYVSLRKWCRYILRVRKTTVNMRKLHPYIIQNVWVTHKMLQKNTAIQNSEFKK